MEFDGVKGSDTSAYVLLYMLDRGESEVTGSAAGCVADCMADLVYYAAEGERLMGLVETRRLMAMQKQQRAKAGMKVPMKKAWPSCLHFSRVPAMEVARKSQKTILMVFAI